METYRYRCVGGIANRNWHPDELKMEIDQFIEENLNILEIIVDEKDSVNTYQVARRHVLKSGYAVTVFRRRNKIYLVKWW